MTEATSVYVIGVPPSGPFKIGIARDPRKRLSALRTPLSFEIDLLSVRTYETRAEAIAAETAAHAALEASRLRGEWFACPFDAAVDAIGGEPPPQRFRAADRRDARQENETREKEIFAMLFRLFENLNPEQRKAFARLYGIAETKVEALAAKRAAEIMRGAI